MPTLLHIDASASLQTSISRALSAEFVHCWQQHPDGTVIRRDLALTTIPTITQNWISAAFAPATSRSEEARASLALSGSLIAELRAADEYVIGTSMYNFAPPASLKLWVDQVVRLGETYAYIEGKRQGVLQGKAATVLVASGGTYEPGTPGEAFDFVTPYLRAVLGYMGVTAVQTHAAGGTQALLGGKTTREQFLAPHLAHVRALCRC